MLFFFIILFQYFQISTLISILTHGLYGTVPANFETYGDLLRHTHTYFLLVLSGEVGL